MKNITGQEKLVGEVFKILEIFKASESKIRPHFILTGTSGSGKSFTIKNLAQEHDLAFIEINGAQLTKEEERARRHEDRRPAQEVERKH